MPHDAFQRPGRTETLKLKATAQEKKSAELAAEEAGVSFACWARGRLFGNGSGVSALTAALTEGDERSRTVVLLALLASQIDDLDLMTSPDSKGRDAVDLILANRDAITGALNRLFADEADGVSAATAKERAIQGAAGT